MKTRGKFVGCYDTPSNFRVDMQVKLVLWGPGLSGKTTFLRAIAKLYPHMIVAGPIELATSEGRTIWEDYLALQACYRHLSVTFHIYTTTGQRRFLHTREYVVGGADAILFVADSRGEQIKENKRSWEELTSILPPVPPPVLVAANKQDLPGVLSCEDVASILHVDEDIVYPTIAREAWGVDEVFKELVRSSLIGEMKPKTQY
nr:ADP-ribosylation factor-like protein [Candidatus Freyrarchaeum guaymaensis]